MLHRWKGKAMTEAEAVEREVADYWRTSIIDMVPGRIAFRGVPVQDLIGKVTFPEMIWRLLRTDRPSAAQAKLLECALVAAVDHGPQAPSIAIARMAVTCGLPLNGAMASAVNTLDDVHGGAGEQAVELYQDVAQREDAGASLDAAIVQALAAFRAQHGKFIAGFGHRFHKPVDPRAPRLMACVAEAKAAGAVSGRYAGIALAIEQALLAEKNKAVPMNIDGATAVIYAELGFAPPLARGLFCLSRSVGILAHAWEQMQQGGRNKGPTPKRFLFTYEPAPGAGSSAQ
jgi:citrate synthase